MMLRVAWKATAEANRPGMNKAPWHPVPVRLVDEIMPALKDTELRVLLVVLRQTAGWRSDRLDPGGPRKRRDWLSHRQLCRRTGRGSGAVSAAVSSLVNTGLLVVEDGTGTLLNTPEERRRSLGRLYFRLGAALEIYGSGACGKVENRQIFPSGKTVNDNRAWL